MFVFSAEFALPEQFHPSRGFSPGHTVETWRVGTYVPWRQRSSGTEVKWEPQIPRTIWFKAHCLLIMAPKTKPSNSCVYCWELFSNACSKAALTFIYLDIYTPLFTPVEIQRGFLHHSSLLYFILRERLAEGHSVSFQKQSRDSNLGLPDPSQYCNHYTKMPHS